MPAIGVTPFSRPTAPRPEGGAAASASTHAPPVRNEAGATAAVSSRPAAPVRLPQLPRARTTDASSSGPGYGSARAEAYKQTKGYHDAVGAVFRAQPPAQKAAIIKGLLHGNGDPWTLRAVRDAALTGTGQAKLNGGGIGGALNDVGNTLGGAIHDLTSWRLGPGGPADPGTYGTDSLQQRVHVLSEPPPGSKQALSALESFRENTTPPAGRGILQTEGGNLSGQFAKNAGKDFVSLPGSAISTAAIVGGHLLHGQVGKAAQDVISPFEQAIKHPQKAFLEHPLITPLMFTGLLHGAARAGASPIRALASEGSAAARVLSTDRPGVTLTGNLTHERAPYSKSPTVKHLYQVPAENTLYRRSPTGELFPRGKWLRDRQLNQEIGQLVGTRERIRRVQRETVRVAREKATRLGAVGRAAYAAKTALAYNPKGPLIPGASVLSLIADGTIRRPETLVADLQKHLAQVASNRPNLIDDKPALDAHDAYVKAIHGALTDKAFLKNPLPAFKAAEQYAREYPVTERQAHLLGHFGPITADQLERRALSHVVQAHWPGARFDEGLQTLVHDAPIESAVREMRQLDRREAGIAAVIRRPGTPGEKAAAKTAILRIQARKRALATSEARPIPTASMRAFAQRETGGRPLAYTSDRVSFDRGNKAFYVSSERRPLPNTSRNTLYAYTHGLTRPGHESLLEQHVLMRGIVDSHHAQNSYLDALGIQKTNGGYWDTYQHAKRDGSQVGLVPINVSQPFHPLQSLEQALKDTNPSTVEEEAHRRSLDLSERLRPDAPGGRWALIDPQALKALKAHENLIAPNPLLRTIRGLNNQFRTVALSTSAKHIPGVMQENIIRDIGYGVGFRSWVTGRRILNRAQQLNPEQGRNLRIQLTGGQVAGMTDAGKTYTVADHWAGTTAHPFLKAMEAGFKAPGPRQLRTIWRAWTKFAIQGTKKVLEEQHQIAGLGKHALGQHGYVEAAKTEGFLGLMQRAFALHGQLLDDATKGLFNPRTARQARAAIQQMYGKWTDLSPSAQTAMMFSPFGLWWVNSARFLARMPIDQPVKTALLASATAGTQQERQKLGLDMFAPGALPLYEQGGIPAGGHVLAQNYYSPFGIANDPLETGQSLVQPWLLPMLQGAGGVDWLWKGITSPNNPKGHKTANMLERAQYIVNSAFASFIPVYSKAQQVVAGGASAYDVSPDWLAPATKTPGKGAAAGLEKALTPFRSYKRADPTSSSGGGSGGNPWSVGGGNAWSGGYAGPSAWK